MQHSDVPDPLQGIRVLERGNNIAAPTAGRMLGKLVRLSASLLGELDEPNRSRPAQGTRSRAEAFDRVLPANARA